MPLQPASHFQIQGKDVMAVVETSAIDGHPLVSLEVDGQPISDPSLETTPHGHVLSGIIDTIPDSHVSDIVVAFPEVNLSGDSATFSCFATITKTLTSIAGPAGVPGALQHYELRPLAGTASRAVS